MTTLGKVEAPLEFGRFLAARRTDGVWIVLDRARPMGAMTIWRATDEQYPINARERASDVARVAHEAAIAKGEKSEAKP